MQYETTEGPEATDRDHQKPYQRPNEERATAEADKVTAGQDREEEQGDGYGDNSSDTPERLTKVTAQHLSPPPDFEHVSHVLCSRNLSQEAGPGIKLLPVVASRCLVEEIQVASHWMGGRSET